MTFDPQELSVVGERDDQGMYPMTVWKLDEPHVARPVLSAREAGRAQWVEGRAL
jgi:hypothetical protein